MNCARAAALISILLCSGVAFANPMVQFNIPNTTLKEALLILGQQANLTIVLSLDVDVEKYTVDQVVGSYAPLSVFDVLLDKSELTYRQIAADAFVIERMRSSIGEALSTVRTDSGDTTMKLDNPKRSVLRRWGAALAGVFLANGVATAAERDSDDKTEATYIEEIIVTAEKREESILEVPLTMSAFTTQMIEELGMANNADIEALTPGLQLAEDGDFNSSSLRGIQTVNARETNADLAVATYVDGVYTVDSFGISPSLFDLERLEIARGPQGTLNGRNSIAGSLSYVHKRPTDEWDMDVLYQFTDQVTQRLNIAFGGPINDSFGYRITAGYYDGDGATKNYGLGDDYDAPHQETIAPQLRFKTDSVDVNLRYQRVRDTGSPDVHTMLSEPNRTDASYSPEWFG